MKRTEESAGCDLRYVYLYRTEGTERGHSSCNEEYGEEGRSEYSSTDYFNRMVVTKGNIEKDTLASVWGIWPGSDNGTNSIAAQSYTLYGNAATAKIYGNNAADKNPFDHKEMKYMSIVQVHITPEIFARTTVNTVRQDLGILDPFLQEIQSVLELFSTKYGDNVSKVYYMLASGDFAVVVAGNDPSASFRLSSLLRSKKTVQKCADGTQEEWVLFKTYTLLVSRDCCEEGGSEERSDKTASAGERFVIRGCYSNLYWKNYQACADALQDMGLDINMGESLNGRYDFTVTLSEEEYGQYETILRSGSILESGNAKVKWLGYLAINDYLSYINRRLLIGGDTAREMREWIESENISSVDSKSWLSDAGKEKLENVVEQNVDALLKLYEKTDRRVGEIKAYRKNFRHNLYLVQKLILQCRSINAVSDTRIYAVVILKQIFTALCSLNEHLDVYEKSDCDAEILNEITSFLQESVRSINVYADYIRNNNLQTLQMPNYNTETSSSLEKLLIGYSEFVRMIYDSVADKGLLSIREVVPIVVPALEEDVVSVEVMFADGTGKDWAEEEPLHKLKEKLVVLKSPTQTELSYMSTMIFSLLHEIAHQHRFEKRCERNRAVCATVMDNVAKQLADTWRESFQAASGKADFGNDLQGLIERCVKKVYFNAFWADPDKQMGEYCLSDYGDTPLTFFQKVMEAVFTSFFRSYEPREQLRAIVKEYLKSFAEHFDYGNERLRNKIVEIEQSVESMEGDKIGDEKELKNRLSRLEGCMLEYHREIESTALSKVPDENEKRRIQLKLRHTTKAFLNRLESCCAKRDFLSGTNRQEYLHGLLYNEMHREWSNIHKANMSVGTPSVSWSVFGRWAWIDEDTESNRAEFDRMVRQVSMHCRHQIQSELPWTIGQYREETADIFMCRAGDMSFSDYVSLMLINVRCEPEAEDHILDRMVHVLVSVWCEEDTLWEDAAERCMEVVGDAENNLESVFEIDFDDRKQTDDELRKRKEELLDLKQELYKEYAMLPSLEVTEESCGGKRLSSESVKKCREGLRKLGELYRKARVQIQECIELCRRNDDTEAKRSFSRALKKIRHYIKLVTVMDQLMGDMIRRIDAFQAREEYSSDLRKGAEVYKKNKYLRPGSPLDIFDFDSLKPIYPKSDQKKGVRGMYNSFCIETLLALFYSQKIRYAHEPEIPELLSKV